MPFQVKSHGWLSVVQVVGPQRVPVLGVDQEPDLLQHVAVEEVVGGLGRGGSGLSMGGEPGERDDEEGRWTEPGAHDWAFGRVPHMANWNLATNDQENRLSREQGAFDVAEPLAHGVALQLQIAVQGPSLGPKSMSGRRSGRG